MYRGNAQKYQAQESNFAGRGKEESPEKHGNAVTSNFEQ